MKNIEITFNDAVTKVKFAQGMTKTDFRFHNGMVSPDVAEQANLMYSAAQRTYANGIKKNVEGIDPIKGTKVALQKSGTFIIRNTLVFETKADRMMDREEIKEWARKSDASNLKRQESARTFLAEEKQPITSNTNERRVEQPIAA